MGILRGGGAADHGLALGVLAVARNGGYLENATHRFVEREFREDLRRVLRHKLRRYSVALGQELQGFPEGEGFKRCFPDFGSMHPT